MVRLTFQQLATESARYDEVVRQTSDIDHFCSSSLWILPAARHLVAPSTAWILRSDNAYVALARSQHGNGTAVLHPFDTMWTLACPLVGAEPEEPVELFTRTLLEDASWDVLLITGLVESSRLFKTLVPDLVRRFALSRGPTTRRYVADLREGVEGFLSRRSPGFRKNLRKAERRSRARGVEFEIADDEAGALFERILDVERKSWKGHLGVGIDTEPLCSFYREMNDRLVERGLRRLVFATLDGEDVAYIFGGVFGRAYRGLQFSFDHRFSDLSLGNLCQIEEMRRLADQGIESYDLGTEVAYKKRWGDRVFTTSSLLIRP